MTNLVGYWQNQILEITRNFYANNQIDKAIETAFLETPRHLFDGLLNVKSLNLFGNWI